jgi:hypothetical protein
MDTTDALIGVSVIGFGVLIGYAAYRDKPVFGSQGLLTDAIQTGKLQTVAGTSQAPTTKAGKSGG